MTDQTYAARILQARIDTIDSLLLSPPGDVLVDEGRIIVPEKRELLAAERIALVACLGAFDRRIGAAAA